MRSLADATGGRIFTKTVSDPLGIEAEAEYAILGDGIEPLYENIDAIFGITEGAVSLEDALANGPRNLERTRENVARPFTVKIGLQIF